MSRAAGTVGPAGVAKMAVMPGPPPEPLTPGSRPSPTDQAGAPGWTEASQVDDQPVPIPPGVGRAAPLVDDGTPDEVGTAAAVLDDVSVAVDDEIVDPPGLPPGRFLELEGRGAAWVRADEAAQGRADVLLVHGWTVTADATFAPSYPALAGRYRVIAPDLRGHGRGLPAGRGLTLETVADDLAATMDAVGSRRAIVVGYSMGGAVAQLLWQRHREKVAGLVLCSTARHFQGGPGSDVWYRGQAVLAPVVGAFPGQARARMAQAVEQKVADGPYAAWFRRELLRSDPASLLRVGAALGRFRSTEWIGEVDVPTAVIITTLDRTVAPGRQRSLAAAIAGARVYEVAGPHNAAATRPAEWVGALRRALDDLVDRSPELS